MSNTTLPNIVDPFKLARKRESLVGSIILQKLKRLNAVWPQPNNAKAKIALNFSLDDSNRCFISGTFTMNIRLECQRCMQPIEKNIQLDVQLMPVYEEVLNCFSEKTYEPIVLIGSKINLNDLVEDEILLTIPFHPKHVDTNCFLGAIKH